MLMRTKRTVAILSDKLLLTQNHALALMIAGGGKMLWSKTYYF